MTEDGQGRYYLQDEMGSPIRLMDEDGDLKDSYGYDEFGNKDLVRILTMIIAVVVVVLVVLAIACIAGIVSGGSLFLGAAALFLLFTLWENNNVSEQEECVEA